MKTFTGKANTFDAAISQAAQAALAGLGPDAMISFSVKQIRGTRGGIAGLREIEVEIAVGKAGGRKK